MQRGLFSLWFCFKGAAVRVTLVFLTPLGWVGYTLDDTYNISHTAHTHTHCFVQQGADEA